MVRASTMAAVVVAAAAACSFDVKPGQDAEPGVDSPPVVERELVASDGSREFPAGWWDTRHQVACSFVREADGVNRCEPQRVTSYTVSLDPACAETFRAVLWEPQGFFRLRDSEGAALDGYHAIAARIDAAALYWNLPLIGCVPFQTEAWSLVDVVPDPPLYVTDQVSSSAFETRPGSRLRDPGNGHWYDSELDEECQFESIDGAVRCVPDDLDQRESINLFANPACDNSEVEVVASTATRFVLARPALRILEREEPYTGPLYRRTFTACVEATATIDVDLARPVGHRLVRGLLLPGP